MEGGVVVPLGSTVMGGLLLGVSEVILQYLVQVMCYCTFYNPIVLFSVHYLTLKQYCDLILAKLRQNLIEI